MPKQRTTNKKAVSGEPARPAPWKTDAIGFAGEIERCIRYALGRTAAECSSHEWFRAVAMALRQPLIDGMTATEKRYLADDPKRVYYLSAEFLVGRLLRGNLENLEYAAVAREATARLGGDLDRIFEGEPDAALGNGGLGRLAACFLDSMASLDIPGFGYGINYQFGLFRQEIMNGRQVERPDLWMYESSPWQIAREDQACVIPIYGHIEHGVDREGGYNPMWMDWKVLIGVPYDIPVVGYRGRTINYLRLYSARASDEFDVEIFNGGDYIRAVEQKVQSETVSKVLYPSDAMAAGKELRLIQEYFLVACAVRDIMRRFLAQHTGWDRLDQLPSKIAIQLNDTHPALAVAEWMRMLVDEHSLEWEKAWSLTQAVCGYTNHTLLPEALEKWPVDLFERVLPRHLQIIYEINQRFLAEVSSRWPGDNARAARMSLIEEADPRQIRMAHLAIAGSHSVNGVAALHSELVKSSLVPDFCELYPERFNNKTNGVTHRRWLLHANPDLAALISSRIGPEWIREPARLRDLDRWATDGETQTAFRRVKQGNKEKLARLMAERVGVSCDCATLFDVQVKRIHEYKRQLLNVMHIVHLYLSAVEDGRPPLVPRTVLLAGKAAPGYFMAKLIIKLIHNVGAVVNRDSRLGGALKVAFLPDYCVSLAERIIPAADLSEQLSTAGMEASGTGNMKLAMNGALTIGTMDGANVEIRDEVGEDNIYIFGLRAGEVENLRRTNSYNPWKCYDSDDRIRRVMDSLAGDRFCENEPGIFRPIHDALMFGGDYYLNLADLPGYIAAQERVAADFGRPSGWSEKCIRNIAGMGKFSSDRTIEEYAASIWNLRS
jgi:starch phosphorylase